MKPCFAYIRVSTQKQGEGVSLEAQRDAINTFAIRQNLNVTRWFEEKETAAKRGRPVFNQMLRQLKRGAATGLIMHKIDRSARNLRDWAIISELPDAGIDVHIAAENLDFHSRGGRLTADIQAVIAADYIRNLREETIKGIEGRLKQGLYPFPAPIGYCNNGRGQPKTPCPERAPLIRQAFSLYASGRYSYRSLREEMERRGLRSGAGKPISLHGLETILQNPFYTGLIEIKRTGETYRGLHQPIVDAKTFARAQEVREGKAGKKTTRHNHLYRGLFRCGYCHGPMTPELQKGCVYYRCQRTDCATKTVREDRIETAVQEALRTLQLSNRQVRELRAAWQARNTDETQSAQKRALDMRMGQVQSRLTRLTDLLIDGTLSASEFNQHKRGLFMELGKLEEQRASLLQNDLPPEKMEKFLELMNSLENLYILANAEEKRCLVENVFSNLLVSGKNIDLQPSNWLQEPKISELSQMVTHIDTLLELLSILPRRMIRRLRSSSEKYSQASASGKGGASG